MSVAFSPDGKWLASGSRDGSIKLWNAATGDELASLFPLEDHDWAVVDPQGRFDASPGGMRQIYYMVGPKPIEVRPLHDRYYTPGLLSRLMGLSKHPLRPVPSLGTRRGAIAGRPSPKAAAEGVEGTGVEKRL